MSAEQIRAIQIQNKNILNKEVSLPRGVSGKIGDLVTDDHLDQTIRGAVLGLHRFYERMLDPESQERSTQNVVDFVTSQRQKLRDKDLPAEDRETARELIANTVLTADEALDALSPRRRSLRVSQTVYKHDSSHR